MLCIRMYPLVYCSLHLLSEHLKYLNTISGCSFIFSVCICSVVCSIRVYKQHSFFCIPMGFIYVNNFVIVTWQDSASSY